MGRMQDLMTSRILVSNCVHFCLNYYKYSVFTALQRTKIETFQRSIHWITEVKVPSKRSPFNKKSMVGQEANLYELEGKLIIIKLKTKNLNWNNERNQCMQRTYSSQSSLPILLAGLILKPLHNSICFYWTPYLQNTVAVDKQVARLYIPMKNSGRMKIFQTCTYNKIIFY
jgi:hypothetical protein